MDILEEFRSESDRTICIVGTIILSTKLCMVDGNFSSYEKDEILKTFPTNNERLKETVLDVIDKASKDKNDITYHAQRIKKFVDPKHKNFLEFIIATLMKFAKADHHFDNKEKQLINSIIEVFEIDQKKNFFQKIKDKFGALKNENIKDNYYLFLEDQTNVNNKNIRVMTRYMYKDLNMTKPLSVDCYVDFNPSYGAKLADLEMGTKGSDFKFDKIFKDNGFNKQQFVEIKNKHCQFKN